jgi:peptidoglycan/LPS O-acetylase OafA/YrhL
VQETPSDYFPAIDGLRALAVAAVLLFHAGHLSGGFLGVDTFFVISGFLITRLLLREVETTGSVALGAFWARRARRLLPALALMICVLTVWNLRYGTPPERLTLRHDTLWSLSFLMNWHEVFSAHDYWSSFAEKSPLTHLWSLAVEEQFYVVWPLVALAVVRWARRPQRAMFAICASGTVASFVLMTALYDPNASTRVYEGTDTRIGAMMIGAMCATSTVRNAMAQAFSKQSRRSTTAAGFGLASATAVVLWLYVTAHGTDSMLFRGGFFIFAAAVGLLLGALTVDPLTLRSPVRTTITNVLSLRPLRAVGRLSYGLYLWHWPIFVVLNPVRTGLGDWALVAVRLSVTAVVSVLSYRFIERPVREGLQRRPTWVSAPATGLAVGLAALVAVTVAVPGASATAVNLKGIVALTAGPTTTTSGSAVDPSAGSTIPATATTLAAIKRGTIHDVVLFGDSIAYTTQPGLQAALSAAGATLHSAAGPGVRLTGTSAYFDYLSSLANTVDSHTLLVMVQLSVWDAQFDPAEQYNSLVLLHQFIVDRGAQMIITPPPPMRPDQSKHGTSELNNIGRRIAAEHPATVTFLDTAAVWSDRYAADLNGDHVPERMYDGVHMCASGAALVSAWLVEQMSLLFDGISPAPVAAWAGGPWTQNPIYDSPAGTCAAV